MKSVAELQRKLREAQKREDTEKAARKDATPVRWQFTVKPDTTSGVGFHEVYDTTCRLYRISGKVINRAEATAAGHPDYAMRNGGMTYAYNMVTRKVITSCGGGTIFTSDARAMRAIGSFIADYPDGGDITAIIAHYAPQYAR